jgi:lysophospholipase L1-like esterase
MRLGIASNRLGWKALLVALGLLAGLAAPALAGTAATSPGGVTGPPAHYVALGDSYTAGPGIPRQTLESGGCRRSDHNYPHLVAAALEAGRFTDASCAGATTAHMAAPQPLPGGLTNGPQFDALDPGVDLVTLGIGGNDIGFASIAVTCAALSVVFPLGAPCRHHYTRHGDEVGQRIEATRPKVAAVLAAIAERAPAARIFVVGYPVILPAEGFGCWPFMPIALGDVAWLRGVEQRLNDMLAGVAADAGVAFVDIYTSSVGHDVCRLPGRKWVEGFVPTSPASAVHPNALGMANAARQIVAAVGPAAGALS